ncbi:hypothetical protein ACHWQZ_G001696 [Mnemiopsis leidyi]
MIQHYLSFFLVILITVLKSSSCTNIEVEVLPSEKELPIGDSVTLTCSLDDTYRSALGSSISWEYPPDVNMETVNIENTFFTITSMAENNIGTYTCKYIGFKDGIFLKGSGSSVISIKPEQPGQPQNMAAAGFTEDSITLQWEAGFWGYADTLYYKLEYSEEESAWKPWNEDIPADILEYEAEGLRSETSYKFRISQVSKGGQSIPSDPTSPLYLLKPGAVTVYPKIMRTEQLNSTAIRVIWQMPDEFSDIVNEWFVEYRLKEEGAAYKAVRVDRKDLSMTISTISGLEEASVYQIRMYCRNEHGRGPPSRPVTEESTAEAAPSAPPRDVRAMFADLETRELNIRWSQPPQRDINGVLTGYQIKLYYTDPAEEGNTTSSSPSQNSQHDVPVDSRQFQVFPTSFPCWVAVAAKTGQGIGPFSDFEMVALPLEEPVNGGAMNEVMDILKQPWVLALVGALVLILIVMIGIIACRQQKIKRRKLEQQQVHTPFLKSYHSSVNSSMNGQQYRMRDDGPQYEKIPDSRNTTPHNSYIDNRMPPQNYCPSNLSMDSRQYSMSQNSSIDDLASTIPSVTYSIPHSRDGYKVVNPTHNDGPGREIPVAKVPPKAKEHDPNAVKPKVYGNVTVKEWREQQLRKKTRGGGESDTSLLSSFGKDSGRGSTDNVSVSGSESDEGSDVEKYLEEDFSPRNSMSRSPPESSAFLNPNRAKNQPPIAAAENNHRPDDNTSIGSELYMRCEAAANTTQPVNIYNLNGGVSEADD